MQWAVRPIRQVEDSLWHCRADKAVFKNCRRFIESLEDTDNPAATGIPKKGKHSGCFGTHIAKSVVAAYRIECQGHRIDLPGPGGRKTAYGRGG